MYGFRRFISGRAAAALLFLVAAQAVGGALPPQKPRPPAAIVTDKEAFLLGEAQRIADGPITHVLPAPVGPYVLIVREDLMQPAAAGQTPPTEGELQVLLWNQRTGRITSMWRERVTQTAPGGVVRASWIGQSDAALVQVHRFALEGGRPTAEEDTMLLVSTRGGAARPVSHLKSATAELCFPANHPFAVVYAVERHAPTAPSDSPDPVQETLRIIRANGTLSAPVLVPHRVSPTLRLTPDGSSMYAYRNEGKDPETGKIKQSYFTLRVTDGQLSPIKEIPREAVPTPDDTVQQKIADLPVHLETRPATLKDVNGEFPVFATYLERADESPSASRVGGVQTPTVALSATSAAIVKNSALAPAPARAGRDTRALVATDGEAVTLTPEGTAALYRTAGGTLYAVPILRLDRAAFLAERRATQKRQAMENGKQVALAVLMYSQDYDDTFPYAGGDVRGMINPYLRSLESFQNPETGADGFTWVHPGVAGLAAVQTPATTVMGYIAGPGGRAVIYVDGHVLWEDNPPSTSL